MNSKDLIYCINCGGMINFKEAMVMLIMPPKYKRMCDDCGAMRIYTEAEDKLAREELKNESGS